MAQNNINEQATNITARINVMEAVPNVDINYGPYESVHDAYQTLSGFDAIAVGLTVGIKPANSDTIAEYWFKSGTEETDLVPKSTVDYDNLEHKPQIGDTMLNDRTTLSDIGAASQTDFTGHTENSKIHVPMTWGDTTPIDGFKIEGDKLTVTVGGVRHAFKLYTWHDVPDFYVFFGNSSSNLQDQWFINIGGTDKAFEDVTVDDIMSLAVTAEEAEGFYVKGEDDKIHLQTQEHGELECDYVNNFTRNCNTMFILQRTSSEPVPFMEFVVSTNPIGDVMIYDVSSDPVTNRFIPALSKQGLVVGTNYYNLMSYMNSGSSSLASNVYGINFNLQ